VIHKQQTRDYLLVQARVLTDMGAIRWGHGDMSHPLFQTVWIQYAISPHLFLFRFLIWRGFKNKSDICRILCEELFMLDVTHSQVDVETEFGVVSLNLMFFCFDIMIFSILQVSRDRERLLTASVRHLSCWLITMQQQKRH